jgi:hypothetical protein
MRVLTKVAKSWPHSTPQTSSAYRYLRDLVFAVNHRQSNRDGGDSDRIEPRGSHCKGSVREGECQFRISVILTRQFRLHSRLRLQSAFLNAHRR